jgi:hypothetical protein
VLRKISGSKGEKVTGYWRRLHNEGPHDLYFSTITISVMKSRNVIDRTRCRLEGEVRTGFGRET